jgi:hypothetical protein
MYFLHEGSNINCFLDVCGVYENVWVVSFVVLVILLQIAVVESVECWTWWPRFHSC